MWRSWTHIHVTCVGWYVLRRQQWSPTQGKVGFFLEESESWSSGGIPGKQSKGAEANTWILPLLPEEVPWKVIKSISGNLEKWSLFALIISWLNKNTPGGGKERTRGGEHWDLLALSSFLSSSSLPLPFTKGWKVRKKQNKAKHQK